ncbi:MAG: histidine phosphatase family protein [Pseudomonadota bacterium]
MKRLTLFRHAKTLPAAPGQDDFDRALAERGESDAAMIGRKEAALGAAPDLILCSTAQRTRQTCAVFLNALQAKPEVKYDDDLYLASPKAMLGAARRADPAHDHVMIIAHNPGLHMLAISLIDPARSHGETVAAVGAKFPTGAIASFAFDIDEWRRLKERTGALQRYSTPKALR